MRRGRAAAGTLLPYIFSGTALRCISPSPLYPRTRCPGLTENGSALRTSSSTLSSASPVVAHLRRALCGSRAATPCVLAALIRMGLLKIARLQRADIASSPPHRHHHRTHRRGATTLCHNPVRGAQRSVPGLDTPLLSACRRYATTPEQESDRASGHAFSYPRQRRGHTHRRTCAADAPPLTRQGQPSVQKNPPAEAGGFKSISVVWII